MLYTGGSEPIVLTTEAPQDFQDRHGTHIMIKSNDVWTVYNEAGDLLGTLNGEIVDRYANHDATTFLIKVKNADQKTFVIILVNLNLSKHLRKCY